jgi:hypothetical protein
MIKIARRQTTPHREGQSPYIAKHDKLKEYDSKGTDPTARRGTVPNHLVGDCPPQYNKMRKSNNLLIKF